MNVSMMDSYNLAWKLIYSINGLTPNQATAGKPDAILDSYHDERHTIAEQLIEFDRAFSSMFSGKIGAAEDGAGGLTHDQFLEVFSTGNGFTSGCGIEYPANLVVEKSFEAHETNPIKGTDYLSGVLQPGRRLLNVKAKRHADGYPRDLQDGESGLLRYSSLLYVSECKRLEKNPTRSNSHMFCHQTNTDFKSTGRFRILCLTSSDLLDPNGLSAQSISALESSIISKFPRAVIEQVVLHPRLPRSFMWKDVPAALKRNSEMSFYSGCDLDDVYRIYGVDPDQGALAVIRPDGYVGTIAALGEVQRLQKYLERCLRVVA